MKRLFGILLVFFCFNSIGLSQGKYIIQNKKQSDRINFKFINNLIIIPVEINGVELSFLLDTGVSKPIIFNFLNITDTLKIKNTQRIFLRGLGQGESVEAYKSKNNIVKIGDAINLNQDLYAVFDETLNFAPRLGVHVHGIIGYDLFKDFVVEINYGAKYIKLIHPNKYKYNLCKRCEVINLEFYNNKPYLNANVKIRDQNIPVKLLIDSGGSDSLWLFEDDSLGIKCSNKSFEDFLGHGLSGSVYGNRSIIDEFSLKKFTLKKANVAYPDSMSIAYAKRFKDRNGSVAGNVLKRFNMVVDYQGAKLILKKNGYFKSEFSYNKSGIELGHNGLRLVREKDYGSFKDNNSISGNQNSPDNSTRIVLNHKYKIVLKPAYTIVELRKDSPAERAGLKIGDVILFINGKGAHTYTLQEVMQFFYGAEDKRIRLKVDRGGVPMDFSFSLKSMF